MLRVPTALLLHQTPTGRHHDWLIGTPQYHRDPASGLWTARVMPPSRCWRELRRFDLTPLAPHRRVYLNHQGPVTGGRGSVLRVDRGVVVIHLWRESRAVLEVRFERFHGLIEVARLGDQAWRARVVE